MRKHGIYGKEISCIEGLLPVESPEAVWANDDVKLAQRLGAAYAGDSDILTKFWLYDWQGNGFVLARKGTS